MATELTTILVFVLPLVLIALALVFDSIVLAVLGGIASIFAGLYFITLEDSIVWIGMIFIGLGIYFMLSAFFSEED